MRFVFRLTQILPSSRGNPMESFNTTKFLHPALIIAIQNSNNYPEINYGNRFRKITAVNLIWQRPICVALRNEKLRTRVQKLSCLIYCFCTQVIFFLKTRCIFPKEYVLKDAFLIDLIKMFMITSFDC